MTFIGFRRPRVKDDAHLDFIRQLPCAVCGNPHSTEAAHLRVADRYYGKRSTGKSEKPSDLWTLPLCNAHHSEQHKGAELVFWNRAQINPFVLALSLYACTGDVVTGEQVLREQANI